MMTITFTGGIRTLGQIIATPNFATTPVSAVTLVGQNNFESHPSASGTIAFPAGTQAGDLAILAFLGDSNSGLTSGSGWTEQPDGCASCVGGSNFQTHTKTLVQADIDTPPTFSVTFGGYNAITYRGHTTVASKSFGTANAATVSAPGFTKDIASERVLTLWGDRNNALATVPPGFTSINNESWTFFNMAAADILSADYNEGDITWTVGATGFTKIAVAIEIT